MRREIYIWTWAGLSQSQCLLCTFLKSKTPGSSDNFFLKSRTPDSSAHLSLKSKTTDCNFSFRVHIDINDRFMKWTLDFFSNCYSIHFSVRSSMQLMQPWNKIIKYHLNNSWHRPPWSLMTGFCLDNVFSSAFSLTW